MIERSIVLKKGALVNYRKGNEEIFGKFSILIFRKVLVVVERGRRLSAKPKSQISGHKSDTVQASEKKTGRNNWTFPGLKTQIFQRSLENK